jgi:hypothetical protein
MPNEELSWVEDKEKGKWNLKVNFIFNISKVQVLMDDHLERKKKKKKKVLMDDHFSGRMYTS